MKEAKAMETAKRQMLRDPGVEPTDEGSAASLSQSVSESIESASILFATLPILVVYPFVQRYFVAGVTIGAVKG